jgi:hypothetical protein
MTRESGGAAEGFGVGVGLGLVEPIHMYSTTRFRRFDEEQTSWASRRLGGAPVGRPGFVQPDLADFIRLGVTPYNTTEHVGNLVLNAGWTRLMNLLTNQGATQAYDATHTRIGVGDTNTAAAYTQTDLAAAVNAANRYWQLVSGAGSLGTRTLSWSASFGTGNANFHWQEWGIDQGTASAADAATAPMLNRAVSDQGTKVSGQTWTATTTFTFT